MKTNPYQQYKQTQIQTASQDKLILMLFDGAIKFVNQGKLALKEEKYDKANECLKRAQDIVAEFMASLNFDAGEIANNLYVLYDYIHRRLIEANINKDTGILDEVNNMLNNLKDTWIQVFEKVKEQEIKQNGGLEIDK